MNKLRSSSLLEGFSQKVMLVFSFIRTRFCIQGMDLMEEEVEMQN